jgi:hypothetical protein
MLSVEVVAWADQNGEARGVRQNFVYQLSTRIAAREHFPFFCWWGREKKIDYQL